MYLRRLRLRRPSYTFSRRLLSVSVVDKLSTTQAYASLLRSKKRMDVLITLLSSTENISCSHYIIKKKFFQVKFQIHSFSEKQNKLHTIKKPIILTLIQ